MEILGDLWKIGGPRLVILGLVGYALVQASKHLGTFLEIVKADRLTLPPPEPKEKDEGEKRVSK